jgi:hypothetical protein
LYRTIRKITPGVLTDVRAATATVRRSMWQRMGATTGNARVVLDIDASLVEIHSETKEGTGPTYKGGFGFGPMFCFADSTGEALAALLRPGNAGANSVADHLTVLDAAIGQLPEHDAIGHCPGDGAGMVRRAVQVRTDSAGCTAGFVAGCRDRNIGFAVVARTKPAFMRRSAGSTPPTPITAGNQHDAVAVTRRSGPRSLRSPICSISPGGRPGHG